MKPLNMLVAGVGGQGILFASKIFFDAAMAKGLKVMGAETHGMSQRGGSVVSHFKMGDQTSSMVIPGTADVLLALERTEGLRNLEFLKPGGVYLVNAPDLSHVPAAVRSHFESTGVRAHFFDADRHALAEGKPLTANLYLIGYLSALPEMPFEFAELKEALTRLSAPAVVEANLKALANGFEGARK
ncbi:MAG: indolepyruvate oxidoreductase subunit beta [Deltaproteobacteria bacterium]|nr:indolepyruvate oxidoreductase subunit beta [Deltaproteobacteria bacterium]